MQRTFPKRIDETSISLQEQQKFSLWSQPNTVIFCFWFRTPYMLCSYWKLSLYHWFCQL